MKTNRNTHITAEAVSLRAATEGQAAGRIIEGYASVFNQRSKLIFEWGDTFFEVIEPGAFDDALRGEGLNVLATVNHRRDLMLARTKSGTLRLTTDDKGLRYEIEVPDTTLGNDTLKQVERGDFFESSFVYTVLSQNIRWDKTPEGVPVRYIKKIEALYDVSIVTDGAFANTDVAAREYREIQAETINPLTTRRRALTLLKLK